MYGAPCLAGLTKRTHWVMCFNARLLVQKGACFCSIVPSMVTGPYRCGCMDVALCLMCLCPLRNVLCERCRVRDVS